MPKRVTIWHGGNELPWPCCTHVIYMRKGLLQFMIFMQFMIFKQHVNILSQGRIWQILFVAYYYAILLCAYVFVFQVLTGVLMLYSLAYHLLIFLLFMLVHMSVFLMQCSCQPKFHVRDNKVLTYLLTLPGSHIACQDSAGNNDTALYDIINFQK